MLYICSFGCNILRKDEIRASLNKFIEMTDLLFINSVAGTGDIMCGCMWQQPKFLLFFPNLIIKNLAIFAFPVHLLQLSPQKARAPLPNYYHYTYSTYNNLRMPSTIERESLLQL